MILLGLGSNIGDRMAHLQRAVKLLETDEQIQVAARSSIYETEPIGFKAQAAFLNAVIRVETSLPPVALLLACQTVEAQMGRMRSVRWGPRVIDIDLLVYHETVMRTESLVLPHPCITARRFVLVPLAEIAQTPILAGRTPQDLLRSCDDQGAVTLYCDPVAWFAQ